MKREVDRGRLTTYVTAKERLAVERLAKAEHLSVSQWMAKAVREALEAK